MERALGGAEAVDRVSRQPAVTEWKRAARRHQNEWREARDWPPGVRPQRRPVDPTLLIGSRLDLAFAKRTNANFLNADVAEAVQHRLDHKERFEALDEARLYSDLLSSMPMCFNLLGPLSVNGELAASVARRWFPDRCPADAEVTIQFEWSPGRRENRWLDDRTAFDAVICIKTASGRSLIGIETKYHEHPVTPPRFRTNRRTGERVPRKSNPRYLEVTNTAGLFDDPEWLPSVWCHPVEQIWRDHLLALACSQDPDGWHPASYVLVAPAGNPAWSVLATEYLTMAPPAEETFMFRTLEQLLDSAEGLLPHAREFRDRYLDVVIKPSDGSRDAHNPVG